MIRTHHFLIHIQISDNRGSRYNCTDLQWFMIFMGAACLILGGISLHICVTHGIPGITGFVLVFFLLLGGTLFVSYITFVVMSCFLNLVLSHVY